MDTQENWLAPDYWREREFEWSKKIFYYVSLPCMLGTPKKVFETVQQLKAEIGTKDYKIKPEAMLLIQPGFLKGRLMVEIQKPDTYDANVYEIEPSRIFTDVHEGPMKTVKETAQKVQERVKKEKNVNATNTFYWDFRHGANLAGQRADKIVVLCQL